MSVPAPVFDVDTAGFQQQVLDASHHAPVLVDFWASWCGPCKALGPVLERLARSAGGSFRLAKVDTDANRELAAANGIRSLPTVRLFVDGAPIAEFMGAQPESAVRAFLAQHLPVSGDDTVGAAIEALLDEARVDEAQAALDALPEEARDTPATRSLAARLELVREVLGAPQQASLEARLATDPADLDARYLLSLHQACDGRATEAMDGLLQVLSRNRGFRDGAARRGMLRMFDLLGPRDPLVAQYRRQMASALN